MADRLIRSELGKTKTGYRWIQAVPWLNQKKSYPMWFLTDGVPYSEFPSQERNDLLYDNPELFLEFAGIKPFEDWTCKEEISPRFLDEKRYAPLELDPNRQEPNSIRAFANRYGLLTEGQQIEQADDPSHVLLSGEAHWFWKDQIREMRNAVMMWKMLSPKVDRRRLQQVIRWVSDDDVVLYDPSGEGEKSAMASWKPIVHFTNLKKGDYERAAWCYLATAVNQSLTNVKDASHRLLSPRLVFEQYQPPQLGLHFATPTLLGALWFQFAQAIDQRREYRKCLYLPCKKEFVVGAGVGRNKRSAYCKNSHRVMGCRKRKAEQPSRSQKKKLKTA